MSNLKQYKEDYANNTCVDCPYCGADRPDHSCRNCYSEMNQESCWKYEGHCSEKCLKYITEELPLTRRQKEKLGIKCKCDDPLCAKCLLLNCKDNNCLTHTTEQKLKFREYYNNR